MTFLLDQIRQLMQTARDVYGVNPIIFLVIYLACAPIWYYSLFRVLRSIAVRRSGDMFTWGTVFLVATVAPFVYVMIFGHNLPWWVYAIIAALVLESVYELVKRLRKRPPAEGPAG